MQDIQFGEDVDFGTGEAPEHAVGGAAVDAALGALRRPTARGYQPHVQKVKALYTYFVGMPTNAATYVGGAAGTATTTCNTPYQVIDLILAATASTFNVTAIAIGDTPMILGTAAIPADLFFVAVQNRFVRFTTLQRGMTTQLGFANATAATTPRTITVSLKVRSYYRG